jgi:mannosylglycoprotein endo-beta-mannosidase
MGVREDKYDVDVCVTNKIFTRMVLIDRQSGFKWNLVNIYGASNSKGKADFLVELVHVLNVNSFPFMVGGDFNLVRRSSERNKVKKLSKWSALFNSIIEHWGLKELALSGRSFTWSNNQVDPLFES